MTRSLALQSADVYRLLIAQVALVGTGAAAFMALAGAQEALASGYGGGIALLSAWMLARHVRLAVDRARSDPGRETAVLYVGAVQRFVLILVLFAVGMGQLGLPPVPLLVGFGLAQAVYLMLGPYSRPRLGEGNTAEKWG